MFMEKRKPHYDLAQARNLVMLGRVKFNNSAIAGAELMGIGKSEILDLIMALAPVDFYKSMTSHADHKEWQDVYRPMTPAGRAYVKITIKDGLIIVSFKEL